MLAFEDGATVTCLFQAHTFEDRVLKIDRVTIRGQATVGLSAVLLYGADIGARAYVMPHSVVMKHEHCFPVVATPAAPRTCCPESRTPSLPRIKTGMVRGDETR